MSQKCTKNDYKVDIAGLITECTRSVLFAEKHEFRHCKVKERLEIELGPFRSNEQIFPFHLLESITKIIGKMMGQMVYHVIADMLS